MRRITHAELTVAAPARAPVESHIAREVWNVLTDPHFAKSSGGDLHGAAEANYLAQIRAHVSKGTPIPFVLIAFPFKMWRNYLKTNRRTPDLGELAFLGRIRDLDAAIRLKYAPGTRWTILTEGEIYGELLGAGVDEVHAYRSGVERFTTFLGLGETVRFRSLRDILESFPEFRTRVKERWIAITNECRNSIPDRYRDFFETFLTSQDVRQFPAEDLRAVYGKRETLTPTQDCLREHLESESKRLMAIYLALNEAKNLVGKRGAVQDTFPDELYVSITRKPGRYAFYPVHPKTRYFPHHGVPVTRGDRICIQWLADVLERPDKFIPVFLEGDAENLPFYYEEVVDA